MEIPDTPAVRFRAGVQQNMDVLLVRVIRTVSNAVDRQAARHQHQSQHNDRQRGESLISETLLGWFFWMV